MSKRILFVLVLVGMFVVPTLAFAQGGGGRAGGGMGGGGMGGGGMGGGGMGGGGMGGMGGGGMGGGGMGGRGGAATLDNIKTQMAATDDEWKVIEPKLQKVVDLRTAAQAGGGRGGAGGRGGRGGAAAAGGATATSPVAAARTALQDALQNTATPAAEIATKLKTYRDAVVKAEKDLDTAQKDLSSVLTPRQEAQLVTFGYLK